MVGLAILRRLENQWETVIGGDQDFEIIMSRGVVHDTHQALVRILYKKPAGEEGAGIA